MLTTMKSCDTLWCRVLSSTPDEALVQVQMQHGCPRVECCSLGKSRGVMAPMALPGEMESAFMAPWEATWAGCTSPAGQGRAAPPSGRLQPVALLCDVVLGLYTDVRDPKGSRSAPVHWASAVRPTHSPPRRGLVHGQ